MAPAPKNKTSRTVLWLLLIATIAIVATIATKPGPFYQWDFQTYYHAARVDLNGGNPYDFEQLKESGGKSVHHPFVYPPLTLRLFHPFAQLTFDTAFLVWLAVKIAAMIGLLAVWRRWFFTDISTGRFYLFVSLAFGAAFWLDMTAGNVTMIEQLPLWAGFAALLNRRSGLFCILVLLGSLFKG
ncbi:DUF2029 domain-containing protein, partial [candidate division GN15 bacterium]|nr:DUF2029 domain-containing protein [candidate division GN15 bacterium]